MRTYYLTNTTSDWNVGAAVAGFNLALSASAPGSAANVSDTLPVSATNRVTFSWATASGEPNQATWPTANANELSVHVNVVVAGAGVTYGAAFVDYSSSGSPRATWSSAAAISGTGLKTLSAPSAGTASVASATTTDRFVIQLLANNSSASSTATFTVETGLAQDFTQAPFPNTINDSVTVLLDVSGSSTEISPTIDSATVGFKLTPSGVEQKDIALRKARVTQASMTLPGGVTTLYSDSGTVNMSFKVSSVDIAQFIDTSTEKISVTPSGTESGFFDSVSAKISFTPSGTEFRSTGHRKARVTQASLTLPQGIGVIYTDTGTSTLKFGVSGTEAGPLYDSGVEVFSLKPTSVDTGQFVETGTILFVLSPLVVEIEKTELLPVADISNGSWTKQDGGTTNLFSVVDEVNPDASDYIQSGLSPTSADIAKFKLRSVPAPSDRTDHVIKFWYGKDLSGGDRIDLSVKLFRADGTTLVKSTTIADIPVGPVVGSVTLTNAEASSIPDADYVLGLVIQVESIKV